MFQFEYYTTQYFLTNRILLYADNISSRVFYLRLLAFVSRSFAGRRIRVLSQPFETAVEILKPAFSVAQIFRSPVLVLRVLCRLRWILIILAVTVLLHGIYGFQDFRSSEETVAPSHRRVLVRRFHRVGHGTDHSYIGNVRTKPVEYN